jgi:hypothetical protein
LVSSTVKGVVVNSGGHLKRQFNISLPSQNMALRFSVSKRGLLAKIKGNVGSVSWSQRHTTTGIFFGLLVCYSSSEPTHAESATRKNKEEDICNSSDIKFSHGKEVYTDYSIIGEHQFIAQFVSGACTYHYCHQNVHIKIGFLANRYTS